MTLFARFADGSCCVELRVLIVSDEDCDAKDLLVEVFFF